MICCYPFGFEIEGPSNSTDVSSMPADQTMMTTVRTIGRTVSMPAPSVRKKETIGLDMRIFIQFSKVGA